MTQDNCIHHLIEEVSVRTPAAVAVVDDSGGRLTYAELNDQADKIARGLRGLGVKNGDLVSISVNRSIKMAAGILGILKTGAAYVPLDPNYPQDRLDYMLDDSGASVLLTEHDHAKRFDNKVKSVLLLDFETIDTERPAAETSVDKANAAYVIYTSGTTGNPKGVVVTHSNLCSYVRSLPAALGLDASDRYLHSASISFSSSVRQLMVPLSLGASVAIASTKRLRDPSSLFEYIARAGVTVLDFVPSFWRSCIHALGSKMSANDVHLLLSASEPFPMSVANDLASIFKPDVRIINMYGQTETTGIISFFPVDAVMTNGAGIMPVGSPISHAQMHILDEKLQPVEKGATGELYIGGAGVARGYLNRPELTAERFITDPYSKEGSLYRTGDLARCLPNGAIEYIGRIDDQVKIRGFRIELGEIESVIGQFANVREVVVSAYERNGDKRLAAYFVSNNGTKIKSDELLELVKQKLPDYMVPSVFIQLDQIPLTPNGKVDRKELPAPQQNVSTTREGYEAPNTRTEKTVANIWSEQLGTNKIGIHDNFFDLGGHSLLATQVLVRVAAETGVQLSVADFFNGPTISEIAYKLDQHVQSPSQGTPSQIPVAPRNRNIPLSFAQQRLWFLDKLEPNSAAYNIPLGMRIHGKIDLDALRQAVDKLIARHESLRTTVATINGEGFLQITTELRCDLPIVDISDLSDDGREAKVRDLASEEASNPFDLATMPLFRTKLLKLQDDEHVMLVTMHHVISDGWSMAVFFEELSEIYGGITQGIDIHLPKLKLQYADFASWQRGTLAEKQISKQLEFWAAKLAGAEPLLDFPTDRQRPLVQTYKGANYRTTFSPELLEEVRAFSRDEGVSLFMTLLAAFYTLVYRHTNQDDIVLGIPIANRNYSDIERVIGFFANTLALRADLSGSPSFRTLLDQVKGLALESYDNQDVPFEKLVEHLNPKRSLSHNPIFQVMFGLHNTPPLKQELSGLNLTPVEMNTGTSRFDLEVLVRENADGLGVLAEYSTDLFDESTIERLMGRFEVLLRGIITNPDEQISVLPILTPIERSLIVEEFNDTRKDYQTGKCVHQLFEEQAERTPDAVAVVYQDQQLTYRELNQKANSIAHRLREFNIKPDSLVGLCVERSVEMVAGIFGILKTGAAYVPLDPSYPVDRLKMMLDDSGATVVVSHQNLADGLDSKQVKIVYMDDPMISDNVIADNPQNNVGMQNLAYINYTSGSTGVPKGVAIQHSSLNNYTQHILEILGTDRPLQFANVSTIAADLGNTCIYPALVSGGTVHVISYDVLTNPDLFREYAVKHSIDVLKIVPSHLSALLDEADDGLELPNRCMIVGGEALSWDLVNRILKKKRKCMVINEYGPTESTVGSAVAYIDKIESEYLASASIGKPAANTTTYILNESLQVVPIGVHGEIYIGGSGLARGYLNRPDLTAERFISDPFSKKEGNRLYRTGDLARYLPNGEMEYLGRIDDQVKIRGFRIELGEIESVISQFADVREAVVTTREEQKGDKRLIAYVVSRSNSKIEPAELRNYLREKLPDYMVPSVFIQLEKLPLTPNGKVDKKKLPAPEKDALSEREGYEAPRNDTETKLTKIWIEMLGVDSIGIRDNFFDLGGHSLLAIRMFSAVEETFRKSVPLATLFEAGTIEKLAAILSQEDWEEPEASLVPIQPNGNKIPFYAIHAIGGNVMFYSDLAKYLDKDQPLYGLQARRLAGRQVGHGTIEEMAAFYIKEIVEHQPDGPYCLGGSSFGGLVAYEMARQLVQQGKEVGLLALFDTSTPEYKKNRLPGASKFRTKVHEVFERIQLHKANLQMLSGSEKISYVAEKTNKIRSRLRRAIQNKKKKAVRKFYSEFKGKAAIPKSYIQLEDQLMRAQLKFSPKPYSGEVTLFRASIQPYGIVPDPMLGWDQYVSEVSVTEVVGHHTSIVAEPYVRGLAEKLNEFLDKLNPRAPEQ